MRSFAPLVISPAKKTEFIRQVLSIILDKKADISCPFAGLKIID